MNDPDVLVLLPGFQLPADFAWRIGYVSALRDGLDACGYDASHYRPPRFVAYYYTAERPFAASRDGHLMLRRHPALDRLSQRVEAVTQGQFRIEPAQGKILPLYLLIHDGWSGDCWLRRFEHGFRFATGCAPREDDRGWLALG